MEVSVCTTETNDEELCIINITYNLKVRNLNVVDLSLTLACHKVVVLWICRDSTCLVVLLKTTEDMLEALTTRNSPVASTILSTHIRSPLTLQFLWNVWRIDSVHLREVRELECTRTVSYVCICEETYRSHVLEGNL